MRACLVFAAFVAEALEERERLAAKNRQREYGGTAPGKAKNTSEKFSPVLVGKSRERWPRWSEAGGKFGRGIASAKLAPAMKSKSRAKVAKVARASAGTMKKIETSRQSRRKVSAPCAPPAPVVQRKRPQPMFRHRLEPNQPHDTRSGVVWTVESHRTNPHPSNAPDVRLARRGGPPVAPELCAPADGQREYGPLRLVVRRLGKVASTGLSTHPTSSPSTRAPTVELRRSAGALSCR